MTKNDDPRFEAVSPYNSPTPANKKLYIKPAYRMERVFVTTALACGKVNDGTGHCVGNPTLTGSAS